MTAMPYTLKVFINSRRLIRFLSVSVMLLSLIGCVSTSSNLVKGKSNSKKGADNAMIHAQLAKGYLQQKQYATAKTELEQSLSMDPNHSESNYVMALLMMELEQYDSAEAHFAKAVRHKPDNSAAAHDFGMLLCQIDKERESVEYFEIAANNPLFEQPELSYMRAGECLARIKDPAAQTYLKRALSVNPRLQPALYRLAVIKYDAREYFPARAYIERYFAAINKPQPAALLLAYQIESKLNATEMAERYRTDLLEGFPGSAQANQLRQQTRRP
jgi:type IV pilus assembly protein PilF